jgi:phytoene dehydrogenase-like protein
VAAAIERSARAFGAEVRTGAAVDRVLVAGGRARGVVLAGGEEVLAPVVVSACHPKITFLRQLDRTDLPADFVQDIEHWSTRSGVVKINCAISRLPTLAGEPDWRDFSGGFEIAPSVDQMERSFEEARAGRPATLPFSDGVIPTTLDPSLAPEGAHVASLFTQWVPAHVVGGAASRGARGLCRPRPTGVRGRRARVPRVDRRPAGDRPLRHGDGMEPDRRQHLPR